MSGLTRKHKLGYDGKLFLNNPALGGGIGGRPDNEDGGLPTTPTFEYDKQTNLDDALKTAMGDWKGYNINADPFYQQMVDRYTKNAQLGMEDAMGRAAALTGGYGSSFAQAVGQQAYYNQMDGLNDLALDIYNNAYQRWRDKKNDAWNNYEYYATDKAAKEKQWMIDNGVVDPEDNFDINYLFAIGLGDKLYSMDPQKRTDFLYDQGFTDDQVKEIIAMYEFNYSN